MPIVCASEKLIQTLIKKGKNQESDFYPFLKIDYFNYLNLL
jgi:hypothetical protein